MTVPGGRNEPSPSRTIGTWRTHRFHARPMPLPHGPIRPVPARLDVVVRAQIVALAGVPDDFSAWPVSALHEQLILGGSLSDEQIGLLVGCMAGRVEPDRPPLLKRLRHRPPPQVQQSSEPDRIIGRMVGARSFWLQGGIRLIDDRSGTVLDHGCCVHVDEWTAWADLELGELLVVGHDPELVVHVRNGTCVAWSADEADTEDPTPPPGHPHVEFPVKAVPGQIAAMRRDLTATTDLIRRWADRRVPRHADALVAGVRTAWGIAGPELSGDRAPVP